MRRSVVAVHRREYHASEIDCYKTCPRMYKYQYVMGLEPRVKDHKLWLGTGIHHALAEYYKGQNGTPCDPEEVFSTWADGELRKLALAASEEQLANFERDAVLGAELMRAYKPWAKSNDDFEVLYVEVPFRVPIKHPDSGRNTGVYHIGTLDGVVIDIRGRVWVLDHKTARDFPDEGLLRLDEQMGFYVLAATQLFPKLRVAGVLYNVLRKVSPARAKGDVFRRYHILYNYAQLLRLQQRLYRAVASVRKDRYFEPHPAVRGSGHCTWKCGYRALCISEEDGSDVQALIDGLYQRKEVIDHA